MPNSRETRDHRHDLRRVVITGVGLVTPLGTGVSDVWENVISGSSGIGPITRFDASRHATRIAAEVKGFDPLRFVDRKEIRKMDPFIQYAIGAAVLAAEDAGIPPDLLAGERCGVYVGSGIGGIGTIEEYHKILLEKGPDRISPFFLIATIINEASGRISIRFKSRGPNSASV
ncbi:MAG TPA: beta-ketoacyl synthase N-terminal-like domain-containing protein, partial [Candidatus Aminicenantes bacterium]|nr:beta-ketoacyl synthase N-terminal-like domain-containing protein [Candidatus Aminicenantes bacterium]